MTIREYLLKYTPQVYYASSGDTLKTVASIVYSSYESRFIDMLVAVNGSFSSWDDIEPMTEILYIPREDINMISEVL